MTDGVKPKRAYRSDRRREQAAQTRARVISAAAALFATRGYAGTAIAAVAERAGVSAETVYQSFGSKPALLQAVVRTAARGQDTSPISEQSSSRAVAAETDQRAQLRMFAADIVLRLERVGPLMAVVDAAAAGEPSIAKLQRDIDRSRRDGLAVFVDHLSANGPLAIDRTAAIDTVWALASPELHQLLRRRRGWSRAKYTAWLATSLSRALLPA